VLVLAVGTVLALALAAPSAPPASPSPVTSAPTGSSSWGVSSPSPSRTWDLGRLGAVQLRTELRWGWAGLYGAGYSPSGEPRWIQTFQATLVRGPLTGTSFEWISVGPSPNPVERWRLGQPHPAPNPSGLPSAITRLSVPVPRTQLRLSVQRPVMLLSPRGPVAPARGGFSSGRF